MKRINGTRCYGYDWEQARARFLVLNPICSFPRCGQPSTVVDHIEPHRGDPVLFWDERNWQATCETCHSKHKQTKEKTGLFKGNEEGGQPLDPDHPWNK